MSPERRALLDALLVERFTPWHDPDEQPKALRLIHDTRSETPAQTEQRRRREELTA